MYGEYDKPTKVLITLSLNREGLIIFYTLYEILDFISPVYSLA